MKNVTAALKSESRTEMKNTYYFLEIISNYIIQPFLEIIAYNVSVIKEHMPLYSTRNIRLGFFRMTRKCVQEMHPLEHSTPEIVSTLYVLKSYAL